VYDASVSIIPVAEKFQPVGMVWKIQDGRLRIENGGWQREKLQLATGGSAKIICALNHAIEHRTHLLPHFI
jgi:hypothetical protein